MTAPGPAPWAAALMTVLVVAAVQRGAVGLLGSAGHLRAHRGQHLQFLAPPR